MPEYHSVPLLFLFVRSRRRHTISDRDWSSGVCSSDLFVRVAQPNRRVISATSSPESRGGDWSDRSGAARNRAQLPGKEDLDRSEAQSRNGRRFRKQDRKSVV